MKLHLACGETRLDGWENHDADMDLYMLPLPFKDGSADRILLEHFGEHCDSPQLLRLLDELYRILKPGGVLRLLCPVVDNRLTIEHARDLALNHGHRQVLNSSSMRAFLWMAGFQDDRIFIATRDPEDSHWRAIGIEKDDLETCRMVATK